MATQKLPRSNSCSKNEKIKHGGGTCVRRRFGIYEVRTVQPLVSHDAHFPVWYPCCRCATPRSLEDQGAFSPRPLRGAWEVCIALVFLCTLSSCSLGLLAFCLWRHRLTVTRALLFPSARKRLGKKRVELHFRIQLDGPGTLHRGLRSTWIDAERDIGI
jgi:hypothetical protein